MHDLQMKSTRRAPDTRALWRPIALLALILTVGTATGACVAPVVEPGTESGAAATAPAPDQPADPGVQEPISLDHIHGMGFTPDGQTLIVGTHTGIRTLTDSVWTKPKGPAHDHIALAMTADGYYASGNAAPDSDDASPLGLIKSADLGESTQTVGFGGEGEFHFLGAGYESDAVYLVNESQDVADLPPGLHYSLDGGASWTPSAAQGVTSVIIQLAAHPTDPATIAFGSEGGVILSTDHGDNFELISERGPYPAVAFGPAGDDAIYYGLRTLYRLPLDGGEAQAISMPTDPTISPEDAMIAIAVNPANPEHIAIASFDSLVWQTLDGGQEWALIAAPPAQ